jgi:DNA-binding NtrC family response regulator
VDTEASFLASLDPVPDVILADYQLPQLDALRALALLRERCIDVPVIVVTGALGDEAAVECLRQGAADYLLKDRLARLGQAVSHALDLKRSRDEKELAERALRDAETRLRAILSNVADGIITINQHGQISSINPAAKRWCLSVAERDKSLVCMALST